MSRSVLVDTNVLIDAAVPGRPHHDAAILFENEVAYGGLDAFVAATSLKDAYFLIKGATDEAFAREYIQCLMQLYVPAAVDAFVCNDAIRSDEPDFEDGIIRSCAELQGVDYIVSRDEKAFRHSVVKRMSPQEYVDAFVELEEVGFESQGGGAGARS